MGGVLLICMGSLDYRKILRPPLIGRCRQLSRYPSWSVAKTISTVAM
jgi:hypothetical protein